jgi:hypothetical protein
LIDLASALTRSGRSPRVEPSLSQGAQGGHEATCVAGRNIWRVWPLVAVLVVGVLQTSNVSVARAQTTPDPNYWTQTADSRDTVYRLVYQQSPQSIPSDYDPVAEAEQVLQQAQQDAPASNPEVPSLWQQLRTGATEGGLSPALRTLGAIGLSIGSFELGWKIGSGINAKFLHIGIPQQTVDPAHARWELLEFENANSQSYYGATWPDTDAWVAWFGYGGFDYNRWFQSPCTFTGFSPPSPFEVHGPVASTAGCAVWEGGVQHTYPVSVVWAQAPENALRAPGPIEPYTNQPYQRSTAAPTPPAQSSVEDAIGAYLANHALLRQWLNYQLGSPGESDPLGIGPKRPDIAFPSWREKWEQHQDEFPDYADADQYWQGAADIVEGAESGDPRYDRCQRADGSIVYLDTVTGGFVVVRNGAIETYFIPTSDPFQYFEDQCNQ